MNELKAGAEGVSSSFDIEGLMSGIPPRAGGPLYRNCFLVGYAFHLRFSFFEELLLPRCNCRFLPVVMFEQGIFGLFRSLCIVTLDLNAMFGHSERANAVCERDFQTHSDIKLASLFTHLMYLAISSALLITTVAASRSHSSSSTRYFSSHFRFSSPGRCIRVLEKHLHTLCSIRMCLKLFRTP